MKVWEFFILRKFRAQMQLRFISILRRVAMAAYNFFQCSLMLRVVPVAYQSDHGRLHRLMGLLHISTMLCSEMELVLIAVIDSVFLAKTIL